RAVVGDGEFRGDQPRASLPLLGQQTHRRHRGVLLAAGEGFESGDQCSPTHAGDSTGPPGARLTVANIQKWWVPLANTRHFWMFEGRRVTGARAGGRGPAGEGRRARDGG